VKGEKCVRGCKFLFTKSVHSLPYCLLAGTPELMKDKDGDYIRLEVCDNKTKEYLITK